MGMSAQASVGWGVDLAQGEYGEMEDGLRERIDELLDNDYDLDQFFGFTEEPPWKTAAWSGSKGASPAYTEAVDAWRGRKDAAVPVEFDHCGTYDYGNSMLIVKRTLSDVSWGCEEVSGDTITPPYKYEIDAVNKVLDAIGFTGNRDIKLLLWAFYG